MHDTGYSLLKFIDRYQREYNRPPSWAEMRDAIGSESNGHVSYWIAKLEEAGYIQRLDGSRNVQIVKLPEPEPDPLATAD